MKIHLKRIVNTSCGSISKIACAGIFTKGRAVSKEEFQNLDLEKCCKKCINILAKEVQR